MIDIKLEIIDVTTEWEWQTKENLLLIIRLRIISTFQVTSKYSKINKLEWSISKKVSN